MARDGSGGYSLPEAPFVYDTIIDEVAVNNNFSDLATAMAASLAKDGQTNPTANLPMNNFRHTGVGNASARNDYAAAGQVQDGSFLWGGTSAGTADALTIALSPAIAAYAAGQVFWFIAGATNTGAATLAVNGLTTKAIQSSGAALAAGEITIGKLYGVAYDGTQFQLVPFASQIFGALVAKTSVTAPAITASSRLQQPDGTAAAPGLRVGTSSATGLFSGGDNSVRMSANGTEIAGAYTDGFRVAAGVKFPATQNASSDVHTLDDYEEGTFTPTLTFGGASTGITYSVQSAAYTKIGNRVLFEVALILTSKGSATGNAAVAGLPFQPAFGAYFSCGVDNLAAGIGVNPQAALNTSNTTMAIEIAPTASGSRAALTDANFTATTSVFISGQYRV